MFSEGDKVKVFDSKIIYTVEFVSGKMVTISNGHYMEEVSEDELEFVEA